MSGMPHEFLLDYLHPLEVSTRRMFGNHSIYAGSKMVMATRANPNKTVDNGIWVGTSFEHHESLKKQFPSLRHIQLYKIKKWLLLPVDADDFEEVAIEICELIKKGDERIGVEVEKK